MKGILFKPDMIKAIVENRKTVTRRVIKWRPLHEGLNLSFSGLSVGDYMTDVPTSGKVLYSMGGACWQQRTEREFPHYKVGETVYIKEAWCLPDPTDKRTICYRGEPVTTGQKWKSPMFMPEWSARYFLKIVSVRPERLQEITEEDAFLEGCSIGYGANFQISRKEMYQILWDSINPKTPWASNPWVWRIEFERIER